MVFAATLTSFFIYKNYSNDKTSQPGCTEAINKVLELQEVSKYMQEVPNAKITCDSEDKDGWLIHVYEIVAEENDLPSHTATFDWYIVSPQGEVKKYN